MDERARQTRERGDSARARAIKRERPDATPRQIAHELGCSTELVRQALTRGDQRGRPRCTDEALRAELARMRAALAYIPNNANGSAQARALKAAYPDLTHSQIAARLGIARQTVDQAMGSSPVRGRPRMTPTLAALLARERAARSKQT